MTVAKTQYTKEFFDSQKERSYQSAIEVFKVLKQYYKPSSAIDIGCGVGTWLKAFQEEFSTSDVLGIDGEYVDASQLMIKEKYFSRYDLKKTYIPDRKFGLAISLEVGEHLPEKSARGLVQSLTSSSDVVLFSAAIPGQGGTYHINEQYIEFWAVFFKEFGFIPVDILRKSLWNNEKIEFWYRQNIILFVRESALSGLNIAISEGAKNTDPAFLTQIHPLLFKHLQWRYAQLQSFRGALRHQLHILKKRLIKS